jgi:hypothetical protein
MGHANSDMSDLHDRVREDEQLLRDVAESVGVGFELPKTLTQKAAPPKRAKRPKAGKATDAAAPLTEESGVKTFQRQN